MATLHSDIDIFKEQVNKIIDKINDGKYELVNCQWKMGYKDAKPVEDKNGLSWRTYKSDDCYSLTINYIDRDKGDDIE